MAKKLEKSPIKVQPRTKEQIARDMEVARKRKIVVEKFYPALGQATISVDEAKMLIQAISSSIMEEVLATMRERKLDAIYGRLVKRLAPDGARQLQIEALLNTIRDENLFVAREIVEGMQRAIAQMLHDEEKGRKLESLKPDWNRMLN